MKTTSCGRIMMAALVCSTVPVVSIRSFAQGVKPPRSAPGPAPAPASATAPPGAEIIVPKTVIGGQDELEVRFSAPVIAASMVGKSVPADSVLTISPQLNADLVWQSSRSATLVPKGVVPLGASFTIALRRDVRDAAGKPVNPGPPVVASGPAFVVERHAPRWFSTSGPDARQPVITLYFNDEVNPAAVEKAACSGTRPVAPCP